MFSRSTWLHLRFPFSYFLFPIFLFSLLISPNIDPTRIGWIFFILHFLLYPASNGYNSYFDKDEKSIGGLKNPPPVNKGLYYISLLFDVAAIVLGAIFINKLFAVLLFIYGLVSKSYSHPAIRLKKYPVVGWITTGVFQGFFTVVMCYIGLNNFDLPAAFSPKVVYAGILASVMLLGNYPMTQVYQHEEDSKRGDRTMSILLGLRGTFVFVAAIFTVTMAGFVAYFNYFYDLRYGLLLVVALSPVLVFFLYWLARVWKDESKADYRHTMWLTFLSATCLNAFFIYVFLDSSQVIQAVKSF